MDTARLSGIIIGISFAFTSQGQAAIQKAINLILAEKVQKDSTPLPKKEGKQIALYSLAENEDGQIESYTIGDQYRIEDDAGNYRIITKDTAYVFNKNENTFTIEKIEGSASWFSSFIKSQKEENIQYLGTDEFFGREVEKYLIKYDEIYADEYWFDKKYGKIIRVIEYHSGIREEQFKTIVLKEITIDKDSYLFDTTPPDGAKVIDLRDEQSNDH